MTTARITTLRTLPSGAVCTFNHGPYGEDHWGRGVLGVAEGIRFVYRDDEIVIRLDSGETWEWRKE